MLHGSGMGRPFCCGGPGERMLHLRIWTQLGPPTMGQISVPDGMGLLFRRARLEW